MLSSSLHALEPTTHLRRRRRWGLLFAAGLALGGCAGEEGTLEEQPRLVLDREVVDFGELVLGAIVTERVTVTNAGGATLEIEAPVRGEGSDPSIAFVLAKRTLEPTEKTHIDITYSPTAEGEAQATLQLRSNDPSGLDPSILARGSAVQEYLRVTPTEISFGNVRVDRSASETVAVENVSSSARSVELVEGANVRRCSNAGDPSTFCVTSVNPWGADGRLTLAAGATVELEVQFRPVIAGTRERGTFALRACDSSVCEIEVRLDGLGIEQPFRCDPPSLDFVGINPGSCATETVTCENIARGSATVLGWQITDGDDVFEVEPSAVVRLEDGDSVDIDVTYCPQTLGRTEGVLRIQTDDPRAATLDILLDGRSGGPDIEVLPPVLDFGPVALGMVVERNLLISNLGVDALEISSITADTAGTGAFIAPGAGATVVPTGERYAVAVHFLPIAAGPVQSTLVISSNDNDEAELEVLLRGEGVDLPDCDFELSPAAIDFGAVRVGSTARAAAQLRNVGAADCLFTTARLEPGSDPELSTTADPATQRVAPGQSLLLPVEYRPTGTGAHTGTLQVTVSSRARPQVRIPLTGSGTNASLLVSPRHVDFATLGLGCAARTQTVRVFNPSATPAIVSTVALAAPGNPAFTVTPPTLPLTLAPGASTSISVGFSGAAVSQQIAALEISGTFEGTPSTYVVQLEGEISSNPTVEERFTQGGQAKADVLFVVDFSGGMDQEQATLQANFASFIQFAIAQGIDYQVGVTTSDVVEEAGRLMHASAPRAGAFSGPFANRIVTPSTLPDPLTAFAANVQARPTSGGGGFSEAGFAAAYLALSPPVITGHNAGFLRPDAFLSVVFLSDEPEQSNQTTAPSAEIDFYLAYFQSLKPPGRFTASAIAGDVPSGCVGPGGVAAAAPRYLEMVQRTGGVFQSICASDWSRALEGMASASFGLRSSYTLAATPVLTSLEVFVDGQLLPRTGPSGAVQWTYDFPTNTVRFSPFAVPQSGAQVTLQYMQECS